MTEISLNIVRLTESYALCLSTEGKSPKTIEWYTTNLKRFARFLENNQLPGSISEIGVVEARQFISHLQTGVKRWEDHYNIKDDKPLSAFSVQGYARTIKAFWSWLLNEEYISHNPMAGLKLPKTPKKVISTFSQEEIQRMLNSIIRTTHRGFRNHTMILLLLDTGIRLSELINLQVDDLDFLQSCFLVRGKGRKERVVPMSAKVFKVLLKYQKLWRPVSDSPYFFIDQHGRPLTRFVVAHRMKIYYIRSGITAGKCTPHVLRHSFAIQFLRNGGDVFSLQRILGHSSLDMTRHYAELADSDVEKKMKAYSPAESLSVTI